MKAAMSPAMRKLLADPEFVKKWHKALGNSENPPREFRIEHGGKVYCFTMTPPTHE